MRRMTFNTDSVAYPAASFSVRVRYLIYFRLLCNIMPISYDPIPISHE